MSYQVLRTDTADEQIRDIAHHLAATSGNHAALGFIDGLEAASARLSSFPRLGLVPKWGALARQGFRILVVKSYVVLYTIDDERKRVIIESVVYGRREYWRLS